MSEENKAPLYKVDVRYTDEDFEKFLKFYRYSVKKVPLARMLYLLLAVVFGLAISIALDKWIYLPAFIGIGVLLILYNYFSDKRSNLHYIENNRKAPNATYTFYDDHIRIKRGPEDKIEVMYHDFYTILEAEDVFYLMVSRDHTVILPKAVCPEGLDDFIRGLDAVKDQWRESEEERAKQEQEENKKKKKQNRKF